MARQSSKAGRLLTFANGEVITIIDQDRSNLYGMEEIAFMDGTVLDVQGISDKAIDDMAIA